MKWYRGAQVNNPSELRLRGNKYREPEQRRIAMFFATIGCLSRRPLKIEAFF